MDETPAPERPGGFSQLVAWNLAGAHGGVLVLRAFDAGRWLLPYVPHLALALAAMVSLSFALSRPEVSDQGARRPWAWLAAIVLASVALRLWPLRQTRLPLGYDYGFYKATLEAHEGGLPWQDLPAWMEAQFPPGLPALHAVLHGVAGLDAFTHLRTLWPWLAALLAVPVFVWVRSQWGDRCALVAAGIVGLGFPLFSAYEYLYEKNVVALALLAAALWMLAQRRGGAAGIVLAALAVWHRPTFLMALLVVVPWGAWALLRKRDVRTWVVAGVATVALALPVWIRFSEAFFGKGLGVAGEATEAALTGTAAGTGTFFGIELYVSAAAAYFPFALAAVVLFALRRRLPPAALGLVAALAYVLLRLPFHERFLIMTDLFVAALAGVSLLALLARAPPMARVAAPILLVVLAAAPTLQEATGPVGPPYVWITDEQHDGILWMQDNLEPEATVIASNLDAPYVMADSGRRAFGPGLFDDPHGEAAWQRFFATTNASIIRGHLAVYGEPLYVYHADGHGPGLGVAKFSTDLFEPVHEAGGARIWRYVAEGGA